MRDAAEGHGCLLLLGALNSEPLGVGRDYGFDRGGVRLTECLFEQFYEKRITGFVSVDEDCGAPGPIVDTGAYVPSDSGGFAVGFSCFVSGSLL
jgi:hypothetical protein